MDCLIFKKVSVKCHALLLKTFSADTSARLWNSQLALCCHKSIQLLEGADCQKSLHFFFLPALEGGELAIPKQLISASYPTHATAPVTVLTDRRLRSVGK